MKVPFLLLIISLMAISCKKDGPAGPAGKDGNANVTVFNFGSRVVTTASNYVLSGISRGRIDSSMVLAYYNPVPEDESAWYPVPGLGSLGAYETRYFISQTSNDYTFSVRLVTPAGAAYTTPVTFRKMRIFIVPANNVVNVNGRMAGPDLKDYYAVKEFYNIPD
ncbi:hypothetical protein EG028_09845 [Chitinophaga barathri]|uniref:Uncharacterized protein n=3 Tax=Chitinophaga barathri TaxID=1647451 RepID=A0A3N4MPK5_9BACT|nr:hypothetical protein EG028_09845 [Chitinophaga barathri]